MPVELRTPDSSVADEFLPRVPDTVPEEWEADFVRKREAIERAVAEFPTPFYIYDERGIRNTVRNLNSAFDWADYRNHFAVKATPTPAIVDLMRQEGSGADCSSAPEIVMADALGIQGESIMFTSNHTSIAEYKLARDRGAIVNFDDLTHLNFYREHVGTFPDIVCLRYSPEGKAGNVIIGTPEEAKFGMSLPQLQEAYRQLARAGVKRFGLHAMVASNELEATYFAETARMLLDATERINDELGIDFEFVNIGGGFGIPYRPDQRPVDLSGVSELIEQEFALSEAYGRPSLFTELGRYVTGPHGVLVTQVRHVEEKYRKVVGVDATMADLMRPGMYGAYHHITVLGGEYAPAETYDVAGSLCENNDKFANQRPLPRVKHGDTLVIHDAGAHGRAMGFNYNGKLRCGELLLCEDGSIVEIRRDETVEDLFSTAHWPDGVEPDYTGLE